MILRRISLFLQYPLTPLDHLIFFSHSASLCAPYSNHMSPSTEILIHYIFSMEGVHPFEEIDGNGKTYWLPFMVYPQRLNQSFRVIYNPYLIAVEVSTVLIMSYFIISVVISPRFDLCVYSGNSPFLKGFYSIFHSLIIIISSE